MAYFTLLPIAKFEYDDLGGSIINLLNYERINYNLEEKDLLLNVLDKHFRDLKDLDCKTRNLVLEILYKGYGYIYNNAVFNDVHRERRDMEIRGLAEEIPHFSKIYLEITELCDMDCPYCNSEIKVGYACNSCIRWRKNKSNGINLFNYTDMISRICELWIDEIIISGGNPLLNVSILKEYVLQIRAKLPDVKIKVYTNGHGINEDILLFFNKYNVDVNFILFGFDNDSYKDITGKNGIYSKVYANIQRCLTFDVGISITFLGNDNASKKERIAMVFNCPIYFLNDVYSLDGNISAENKFIERRNVRSRNYWDNQKFNSCLYNKLAISANGLVMPCPMIGETLLDLKENRFDELFQKKKMDKYWRFTKREVEACSKCPYKYSCEDCTAIEIAINKGEIDFSLLCDRFN